MGLCGSHLSHQVAGVDSEVLLLLGLTLKQMGVEGVPELGGADRLRLVQIVAGEEAVEVGRTRIGDVEVIRGKAVALRPEVRRVVLRQGWVGLQERLVRERLLLGE